MSYRVFPVLECFKNLPPRSTISSLGPHHLDPQYRTTGSQLSLIGTSGIQDRNMSGAERLFQPQTPATNYSASQGAYALSLSHAVNSTAPTSSLRPASNVLVQLHRRTIRMRSLHCTWSAGTSHSVQRHSMQDWNGSQCSVSTFPRL